MVDNESPRLSWINISKRSAKGQIQIAYQIRVASSRRSLRHPDLWDSQRVKSANSALVPYHGAALRSMQQCWWQVRVWDAKGRRSRWSKPAHWGMGLLSESDWQACWIGSPWQREASRAFTEDHHHDPAPYLRKSFVADRPVASARAYVVGLGLFQFYINGQKVGDEQLAPNETNWQYRDYLSRKGIPVDGDKFRQYRILYSGYDVTDMVRRGENVMGAMLGNGFYDTTSGWVGAYGSPRFIGQLVIDYKDGTRQVVGSDGTWLAHRSAITVNDLYEGETYDARLAIDDWCICGTDLSDWEPVALREAPCGRLCAHQYVSDRIRNTLAPKSITTLDDGSYELDFGDYITGWVHLRGLRGEAGDTLKISYLCESKGNGPNHYVFRGGAAEEYAPRFTWFAFDKVRISGYKGTLRARNICAEEVYADVRTTGRFECSNGLFNRINHIYWRSQTDNMHLGVATDCPHREKGPYTGDGEVSCVAVMHNFDARAFYTKWIRDMSDVQNTETGYVPNGAPWHVGCGGGPGWGAAMNIMPWEYYLHYGDLDMLRDNYFQMQEQLRFMRTQMLEDGTMYQQLPSREKPVYWMNLGDWLPPYKLPEESLVHTYLLWKCTDCTARAADALGLSDDAALYRAQAEGVAAAFHRRYYDADAHSYGDFGANVLALHMGVPQNCHADVVETLREEIAVRHEGHLNTGIVGTQLIFEVLADNGLNELAFEALNKRDFPSFGYWLEQGAYTTWEAWNGENSHNHPMFGGGLTWLYRRLAGMRADESAPGYRHIIFKPMPCGDVTWASYFNETPFGEAGIRWELQGDGIRLRVKVPVGCTATVYVPCSGSYEQHEVASGEYVFSSRQI